MDVPNSLPLFLPSIQGWFRAALGEPIASSWVN